MGHLWRAASGLKTGHKTTHMESLGQTSSLLYVSQVFVRYRGQGFDRG